MFIYGLDASLTSYGYAIADLEYNIIEFGTIIPDRTMPMGQRLGVVYKKLNELKETYPPAIALIERSFTRFHTATQILYRVHGVTNLAFKGCKQIEYTPTTIKKSIAKSGRATKAELWEEVKKIYPDFDITTSDEADAIALILHYKRITRRI